MKTEERSWSLRLPVKVSRIQEQKPPWHDTWAISMDETSLVQLSAELLELPEPLPPRLLQLRRLVEKAVTSGHAQWDGGLSAATLAPETIQSSHPVTGRSND
jgi:hypothetical protein